MKLHLKIQIFLLFCISINAFAQERVNRTQGKTVAVSEGFLQAEEYTYSEFTGEWFSGKGTSPKLNTILYEYDGKLYHLLTKTTQNTTEKSLTYYSGNLLYSGSVYGKTYLYLIDEYDINKINNVIDSKTNVWEPIDMLYLGNFEISNGEYENLGNGYGTMNTFLNDKYDKSITRLIMKLIDKKMEELYYKQYFALNSQMVNDKQVVRFSFNTDNNIRYIENLGLDEEYCETDAQSFKDLFTFKNFIDTNNTTDISTISTVKDHYHTPYSDGSSIFNKPKSKSLGKVSLGPVDYVCIKKNKVQKKLMPVENYYKMKVRILDLKIEKIIYEDYEYYYFKFKVEEDSQKEDLIYLMYARDFYYLMNYIKIGDFKEIDIDRVEDKKDIDFILSDWDNGIDAQYRAHEIVDKAISDIEPKDMYIAYLGEVEEYPIQFLAFQYDDNILHRKRNSITNVFALSKEQVAKIKSAFEE